MGLRQMRRLVTAAAVALTVCAGAGVARAETSIFEFEKTPGANAFYGEFHFMGFTEVKRFSLANPDRVVVDVVGAVLEEKKAEYVVGSRGVRGVRMAQFEVNPNIVRIVFDMEAGGAIEVRPDAANGRIVVQETGAKKAAVKPSLPPMPEGKVLRGVGMLVVEYGFATRPEYRVTQTWGPNKIIVDLPGVAGPEAPKVTAVRDGVVSEVRVQKMEEGAGTRVVVGTNLPAPNNVEWGADGKLRIAVKQSSVYRRTIVVDPGHGGKDPGAMVDGSQQEKDIVLDITQRLVRYLQAAGARVVMTRNEDVFVSLDDRAYIANRTGADLFLSVHINAMPRAKEHIRGTQSFYFAETSREYAEAMQDALTDALGVGDTGVYSRRYLVLRKTTMKSALCEIAFLTNASDRALLNSREFRENAARGLFNGLQDHLGGQGVALQPMGLPGELAMLVPYAPSRTAKAPVFTEEDSEYAVGGERESLEMVEPIVTDSQELAGRSPENRPAPAPFRKSAPVVIGE